MATNSLSSRTTNNPVLSREDIFTREGTSVGFHDGPTQEVPTGTQPAPIQSFYDGPTMTINDVVVKTFLLFLIGAVGVAISWTTGFNYALTIGAALVGFGLAMVNIFKKQVSPPLVLAYALAEGVFLAGISAMYQSYVNSGAEDGSGTNIVLQAVIGTATAFAVMLALYANGTLRATPKFKKIFYVAFASYFLIAIASFISAIFFDTGDGFGFYGVGPLGIALCAAGVLLASFFLILDFDAIQKGVEAGVPERESWRASFGLLVTLIWLYLEILRLLAILNRN